MQVAIGIRRKTPQIVDRGKELVASFTENLRPGRTYQVVVKTVSGSVASWPATGNVTTRPLPVRELRQEVEEESGDIRLIWDTNPDSQQDSFKVRSCLVRCKGLTKSVVSQAQLSIWQG